MRVVILIYFLLGSYITYGQQELEWVIEPTLEYDDVGVLSEGLAWAKENRKWKLINTSGEVLNEFEFFTAYPFSQGLSRVIKNRKFGFVNVSGELVIPIEFGYAWDFSEGLAAVENDEKWGFINQLGEVVIPFEYDYAKEFSEGLAAVKKDGKWNYINKSGEKIIQLEVDNVNEFSGGLAWVKKKGKWGLINTSGEFIVKYKYHYVWEFSEGLATVELNGKWGYINTSGKLITELEYDYTSDFSDGLAAVEKNRKKGYINTLGEVVIDFEYVYTSPFMHGLAWVTKNGEWGIINSSGKMVTQYSFEDVGNFSDSLAFVRKDEKWGVIRHPYYKKTPNIFNPTTNFKSKGKNYALFIGIADYQYWETLTTPVNDCNVLIDVLTKQYNFERNNIITLYNESATRNNILEIIQHLASKLNSSDNLFIYFSGHSFYDKNDLKGYWIPYEAPNDENNVWDFIPDDAIKKALCKSKGQNIYVIADACYSGGFFDIYRKRKPTDKNLKRQVLSLQQKSSFRGFASSGKLETVNDAASENPDHSPFALALITILQDWEYAALPAARLELYVKELVEPTTNQVPNANYIKRCSDNHGKNDGQFIFYRED